MKNIIDAGLAIIIVSFLIEIILLIIGPYWHTCGMGFTDFFISITSIVIPILLYQKFKERTKLIKWVIVIIGSGLNLLLGIMFFSVVC